VTERRVAAADPEHGAPGGLDLDGGDGGRGDGRVPCHRVGDPDHQPEPLGVGGGEAQPGEGIGGQVLRVPEADAVEAFRLGRLPAGDRRARNVH
jgi:hypothetical protein